MKPATIKIFLTNGSPEGIRTAELSNWTGKAIAGPRSELPTLRKREELDSPGVYFLTGIDPETDQPILYIGEAESVKARIQKHSARDDWSQLVAFVSKDENLTKAHIRYLEGELITLAKKAGRAVVQNSASSGARLPESDQADMDIYLEKLLQLLPVLGVDLFKTIQTPAGDNTPDTKDTLYCQAKGLEAKGKRSAGGFIVYKGSQAVFEHRRSATNVRVAREQLIEQGLLQPQGDCFIFSQDVEFTSPSKAGSVVRGGNTNGLTDWKNKTGQSLKELEATDE